FKMKKMILAIIVVALLLTTVMGSTAFAASPNGKGSVQVPLYPCGPGNSNDVLTGSPSHGKVIINTPHGNVILNITGIV
ncbi:MAG: hypothetical protein P8105_10195, partial [Dehalococcoidia bacterium]